MYKLIYTLLNKLTSKILIKNRNSVGPLTELTEID